MRLPDVRIQGGGDIVHLRLALLLISGTYPHSAMTSVGSRLAHTPQHDPWQGELLMRTCSR
jgi:hypothetical protein